MGLLNRVFSRFLSLERQARNAGVKLGRNNLIVSKFWSSEPFLITIGSNCAITSGVKMFTHGGARVARRKYPQFDIFGKVCVEDWVYIGVNSLIMPGVTIGEGSLVAAGSVVTKSVPKGVVVGGNPAKVICSVDDFIEKNKSYNTNSKSLNGDEKKEMLLLLENVKFIKKSYLNNNL